MRAEKQLLLDEMRQKIKKSPAFIVARYEKFKAIMANDLRKAVNAKGGDLEIVRKRVFLKATSQEGLELRSETLEGHIAIIFTGEDIVETTKTVVQYGNDNEGVFNFVGGQCEGKILSSQDVVALSKLPTKDVMQAQFLGLLEAPMAQALAVMDALLTSVPHCLDNKIEKEQTNH